MTWMPCSKFIRMLGLGVFVRVWLLRILFGSSHWGPFAALIANLKCQSAAGTESNGSSAPDKADTCFVLTALNLDADSGCLA